MSSAQRPASAPDHRPTILQIVPRLDTGGAELTTIEITSAIVEAGGRALVATEGGRMAAEIGRRGGELIEMPAGAKSPWALLANARRLADLLQHQRVDLLHARSRAPAWSALRAARRTGRAFVTTYHGAYAETNPVKRLYNSVMARGDLVIANSRFTADLVHDRYRLARDRIRVIPRGVDPAVFDPAAIAPQRIAALRQRWRIGEGDRVVLQAARLTGWKGQTVLIAAAARLAAEGALGPAVVVLAGDDQGRTGYADTLRQQIAGAGLGDRVRLVGHCSDMPAAYALAHVAVVASIEPEAFGRVAAEAQAMGCPVIVTDIGAPPETILAAPRSPASAITGWLVPPHDDAALASALASALQLDGEPRRALAARARARVRSDFSLMAMQLATLAVYDERLGTALAPAFAGGNAQHQARKTGYEA